jgi:hypothetical protein
VTVSLSETERQKVRMYLGFGKGRDIHPRLETRFDGWLSAEEYAVITDTLTKLDALETQRTASSPLATSATSTGHIKAVVGEVEFFGADNNMAVLAMLDQRGHQLVQRLSIIFEVEPLNDYFGSAVSMGGPLSMG